MQTASEIFYRSFCIGLGIVMKSYKRAFGDYGEDLAVKYLLKNKYDILARNYSSRDGEIDIIAIETKSSRRLDDDYIKMSDLIRNEDVLCFIEVKTRSSIDFGQPSEAVNTIKQKHMYRTAQYFLYKSNCINNFIRFDVIEVLIENGKFNVNHIKQII